MDVVWCHAIVLQHNCILNATLYECSIDRVFFSLLFSMTTIADLNDKWAAYAGPGGWNGNNGSFVIYIAQKHVY